MAHPETPFRLCPTRIDAAPVLLAHKVDRARCQERQRGRYHKCFTCAWNNNYVALHGEPQPVAPPPAEEPAPTATVVELPEPQEPAETKLSAVAATRVG